MRRLFSLPVVIAALLACSDYEIKPNPTGADLEDTDAPATEVPTPPTPDPLAPDIEVEPTQIAFGFLPASCPADPELVTVRNVGGSDLQINDIFILSGGAGVSESGEGTVLAPGQAMQFYVDFTAPGDGSFVDAVRIASNDPDEANLDVPATGTGASAGTITDGFTQNAMNQVDVLFVLDNSGSMSDNLNALATAFPTFINTFVSLGLDYQIGVVTTDMDDPAQSGNLVGPIVSNSTPDPVAAFVAQTNTGSGGSADERGLDAAYAALEPSMGLITGPNAGLVRPGSNLSVLVISDENDSSSMNPMPFANWLDAYQGDPDLTSISIVGGPKNGLFPCTSGFFSGVSASPVPRYWTAAQHTGGIHVNLCTVDFDTILQRLSTVAAGLRANWELQGVPGDATTISVVADGQPIPQDPNDGWSYDAGTNTISFNGDSVPTEGVDVVITYVGETVCAN